MTARRSKSRRPSVGNERSLSPPEGFVLYLDENICNSRHILEALQRLQIRFERHLSHFERGTPDAKWLPKVGAEGWVLLTADKRIRYNLLEKRALEEAKVREFVFVSGNLSGQDMATVLELAIPKMIRIYNRYQAPFVAAIARSGEVHLRWPTK